MPESYACLPQIRYIHNEYEILPLRENDIFQIMQWRNEQINVLRQKEIITPEQQQQYFNDSIAPSYKSSNPELILFSILCHNTLIGYGGLVHINWQSKRAEVSFLTSLERANNILQYSRDFTVFLQILKNIAFNDLKFQRLSTETFDIRPHVITILEDSGFRYEGKLVNNNLIDGIYVDSILHGCLNDNEIDTNPESIHLHNSHHNILITSVSKKVPLLQAISSEYKKLIPQGKIFGSDSSESCLGKHFIDHFWHCPEDKYLTFRTLLDFCKSNHIGAIIPTRDKELHFYARHKNELAKNDIQVMISQKKAIQICNDKLLFYSTLAEKFSKTIIPTDIECINDFGNRIVVKERFGSGSKCILVDQSAIEAKLHAKNLDSPVFQPFISGKEFTVDLYISQHQKIIGTVVRSRDLVIGGESQITTLKNHPKIEKLCEDIALHLNLYGHVLFQAIEDTNSNIHVIECNCRLGGASTLSFHAGLKSITFFIQESFFKQKLKAAIIQKTGIQLIRTPFDHLFSHQESHKGKE